MHSLYLHPDRGAYPANPIGPWTPASAVPQLEGGAVHLWIASLDIPLRPLPYLHALLNEDEQQRAAAFHFQVHRRRYIVGRAYLRLLLQAYLGTPAAQITFAYNEYGKPALSPKHNPVALAFNLSHSQSQVVYAFARRGEIGVDIESIRQDFAYQEVAATVFTPLENQTIHLAEPDDRCRQFFRLWTHKEAYIKGQGKGLSIPLNEFDVLSPSGIYTLPAPWSFLHVPQRPDYAIALAVTGSCTALHCLELQTVPLAGATAI